MAESVGGSAQWAWRLGLCGVAGFVLGPLAAHFSLVPAIVGFIIYDLGGLLSLIAVIAGIIGALRNSGAGRATAVRGLALGGAIVVVFLLVAMPGGKFPRINDITTDTTTPPKFIEVLKIPANNGRDMTYPGPSFAEQQRAGYPDLGPLKLPDPPDPVYVRVEAAAGAMPTWTIVRRDATARVIEGTDTSRLFRFQDDFVIEVRPDGSGSAVQMRSKSRDGQGDLGVNAARIKAFFAKVKG